jgi:lipopolysaccharide transport system permease protein
MFMCAIFYPLQAIPGQWRGIPGATPMVHLIDSGRAAIGWRMTPDWLTYFGLGLGSLAVFLLGYFGFDRSKSAFADVI